MRGVSSIPSGSRSIGRDDVSVFGGIFRQ
jgi:hypothetical protein